MKLFLDLLKLIGLWIVLTFTSLIWLPAMIIVEWRTINRLKKIEGRKL